MFTEERIMLLYVNKHRESKNYEALHSDDHTPNFVVFLSPSLLFLSRSNLFHSYFFVGISPQDFGWSVLPMSCHEIGEIRASPIFARPGGIGITKFYTTHLTVIKMLRVKSKLKTITNKRKTWRKEEEMLEKRTNIKQWKETRDERHRRPPAASYVSTPFVFTERWSCELWLI